MTEEKAVSESDALVSKLEALTGTLSSDLQPKTLMGLIQNINDCSSAKDVLDKMLASNKEETKKKGSNFEAVLNKLGKTVDAFTPAATQQLPKFLQDLWLNASELTLVLETKVLDCFCECAVQGLH